MTIVKGALPATPAAGRRVQERPTAAERSPAGLTSVQATGKPGLLDIGVSGGPGVRTVVQPSDSRDFLWTPLARPDHRRLFASKPCPRAFRCARLPHPLVPERSDCFSRAVSAWSSLIVQEPILRPFSIGSCDSPRTEERPPRRTSPCGFPGTVAPIPRAGLGNRGRPRISFSGPIRTG